MAPRIQRRIFSQTPVRDPARHFVDGRTSPQPLTQESREAIALQTLETSVSVQAVETEL